MPTTDHCPLLQKLPPELRNNIYELALADDKDVSITVDKQPGLAETCRQLRRECAGLHYSVNKFRATTGRGIDESNGLVFIKDWLERIGHDSAAHIKCLTIELTIPDGLMLSDLVENNP